MSIVNYFNQLVGEKCHSVPAGRGTGSVINLNIGPQALRDKPIKNPHLSENARLYDSDFGLLIYSCWRMTINGEIACSWRNAFDSMDKMLKELDKLCGQEIVKIELCENTYDLSLSFKNGIVLDIFCDMSDEHFGDENYTFYTPGKIITIGLNSVVEIE